MQHNLDLSACMNSYSTSSADDPFPLWRLADEGYETLDDQLT